MNCKSETKLKLEKIFSDFLRLFLLGVEQIKWRGCSYGAAIATSSSRLEQCSNFLKHKIPKRKEPVGERFNMTFRLIIKAEWPPEFQTLLLNSLRSGQTLWSGKRLYIESQLHGSQLRRNPFGCPRHHCEAWESSLRTEPVWTFDCRGCWSLVAKGWRINSKAFFWWSSSFSKRQRACPGNLLGLVSSADNHTWMWQCQSRIPLV